MLYKNLKLYLCEEHCGDNSAAISLIPRRIDSKVIFFVGDRAPNTSEFLSSILSARNMGHTRYINSDELECMYRYLQNGEHLHTREICYPYQYIAKKSKRSLSPEWMAFTIGTRALRRKEEYMLMDVTPEIYKAMISTSRLIPYAVVLCNSSDEENDLCISITPKEVREIVSLTQRDNFDYISKERNKNGVHLTYASPNKYTFFKGNTDGSDFFYYDELYHINSIDTNNVHLACLAIEAARVILKIPDPYIEFGLATAEPIYDIKKIYSLPYVYFKIGGGDFKLPLRMRLDIVHEKDFNGEKPKRSTLYVGSREFYDHIRESFK